MSQHTWQKTSLWKKASLWSVLFWLLPIATVLAHGISKADKQAMLTGGNIQYIWLGATHMLTGYDHLLFIFGVIFFLTGFRDIVKFITAFTLGHSITLLFATIWGITANYYLVDAVIAISVIYKGFENLDGFKKYLKVESPNLLWVVFGFGLIHGFGLSTRLQQLPLGDSGMVLRILSFNVGVELGQITALSIMLLLITSWRKRPSFEQFSTVSNAGLIVAGGLLFLMQMHGYLYTSHPDDFGFSRDNHYHEHLNMQKKRSKTHSHGSQKGSDHTHSHDHGSPNAGHTQGGKTHSHSAPNTRPKKNPHTHSHSHDGDTHSHAHDGKSDAHGHSHGSQEHSHGGKAHVHSGKSPSSSKKKNIHSHGGKAHSHGAKKVHSHGEKKKKKEHSHGGKAHTH